MITTICSYMARWRPATKLELATKGYWHELAIKDHGKSSRQGLEARARSKSSWKELVAKLTARACGQDLRQGLTAMRLEVAIIVIYLDMATF